MTNKTVIDFSDPSKNVEAKVEEIKLEVSKPKEVKKTVKKVEPEVKKPKVKKKIVAKADSLSKLKKTETVKEGYYSDLLKQNKDETKEKLSTETFVSTKNKEEKIVRAREDIKNKFKEEVVAVDAETDVEEMVATKPKKKRSFGRIIWRVFSTLFVLGMLISSVLFYFMFVQPSIHGSIHEQVNYNTDQIVSQSNDQFTKLVSYTNGFDDVVQTAAESEDGFLGCFQDLRVDLKLPPKDFISEIDESLVSVDLQYGFKDKAMLASFEEVVQVHDKYAGTYQGGYDMVTDLYNFVDFRNKFVDHCIAVDDFGVTVADLSAQCDVIVADIAQFKVDVSESFYEPLDATLGSIVETCASVPNSTEIDVAFARENILNQIPILFEAEIKSENVVTPIKEVQEAMNVEYSEIQKQIEEGYDRDSPFYLLSL